LLKIEKGIKSKKPEIYTRIVAIIIFPPTPYTP